MGKIRGIYAASMSLFNSDLSLNNKWSFIVLGLNFKEITE